MGVKFNLLPAVFRNTNFRILLLVILLATIGLSIVGDYGISADEKIEIQFVFWNIRLRNAGMPIPEMSEYYGSIFPFVSEAAYQLKSLVKTGKLDLYFDVNGTDDRISNEDFLNRIRVKHPLTFLFSLLTYLAVAGIVGIIVGKDWSWLGVVVLALMPRYWGHSFFNPKDIPYATMFTVGTFMGARLVGYFLKVEWGSVRLGLNRITAYSLLYGILVGLVTGTRIAGCFLLAFVGIAHVLSGFGKKLGLRVYFRYLGIYGVMVFGWIATVFIFHPASWSNPLRWLFDGFLYLSSYDYWEGLNLFNGQLLLGKDIPWYYLPVWLGITTPVLIQILSVMGGLILLVKYRSLTPEQQACAWLVLLQIGFLPGVAVLRNSVIYNAVRQFLFILPGLAVLAAVALGWVFVSIKQMRYKVVSLVILSALTLPTIVDMVNLHPYEYVYFNRVIGGLQGAHERFDTDYWGLSMREGVEWINTNAEQGSQVVTSRHYVSSEPFASPDIDMIRIHEFDTQIVPKPFYTLVLGSYEFVLGEKFADCQVAHQVLRQNIPLTSVRLCN